MINKEDTITIIDLILEIKGLQKMISTYFDGTEALTYDVDGRVHASFSHTATPTGRLGCSKPNVQNQSAEDDD